jgi:hypothetical protein
VNPPRAIAGCLAIVMRESYPLIQRNAYVTIDAPPRRLKGPGSILDECAKFRYTTALFDNRPGPTPAMVLSLV